MGHYGKLDREAMANSAHFGPVRWLRPECPFEGSKTEVSRLARHVR
jgi:hypothetical protein